MTLTLMNLDQVVRELYCRLLFLSLYLQEAVSTLSLGHSLQA